ncbi:hypothetical protein R3P38DRAFT_2771844 [Favolaschia claudopus]|uniref:Uncharacterized protein n=1 Tax=Favolaschia claudopus TaxID=2862362 RepID=A0AAW0CD97_9AGAR
MAGTPAPADDEDKSNDRSGRIDSKGKGYLHGRTSVTQMKTHFLSFPSPLTSYWPEFTVRFDEQSAVAESGLEEITKDEKEVEQQMNAKSREVSLSHGLECDREALRDRVRCTTMSDMKSRRARHEVKGPREEGRAVREDQRGLNVLTKNTVDSAREDDALSTPQRTREREEEKRMTAVIGDQLSMMTSPLLRHYLAFHSAALASSSRLSSQGGGGV